MALHVLCVAAVHAEIVVHHIHKFIDVRPVAKGIALLLVCIVFYQMCDQPTDALKCGIISLDGTVTEKPGMKRIRQRLLKHGLLELYADHDAVISPEFVGSMTINRQNILRAKLIGLPFNRYITVAGENQIHLKVVVHMFFNHTDALHHASQGHSGIKVGNFIVSTHHPFASYDVIIRGID